MSVWDIKKPKRQSMLWGRSDLTEKFYSGEKSSNPWVRDLLWKKNITDEHKKFQDDSPIDFVPPHMRSVTLANVNASIKQKEKRRQKLLMQQQAEKMYHQRPQTSSGYESSRSYRSSGSRPRSSQRVARANLPPLQSESRSPSARSLRSNRSVGSLGSNASISHFTELLQRQNAKLEHDILHQKRERERLEDKISHLETLVKTSVVRSTRSQQRTEKRLEAYKIIVDKLARAASRRELRQSMS